MKIPFLPIFLALSAAAFAAEPPKAPLAVAVFEFQSPEDGVRDLGAKVATLLSADFATDARFISVERAELDKALGEQELGLSGTISQDSAAKVGQLTGARLLVTGRVMKADRETIIVAKIIGTETSRVFADKATLAPNASLADTVAALQKKTRHTRARQCRRPRRHARRSRRTNREAQTGARRQTAPGRQREHSRATLRQARRRSRC